MISRSRQVAKASCRSFSSAVPHGARGVRSETAVALVSTELATASISVPRVRVSQKSLSFQRNESAEFVLSSGLTAYQSSVLNGAAGMPSLL